MRFWLVISLLFLTLSVAAQPVISSFSPVSAVVGSTITITGSGFNTTSSSNIVFFGATKATVTTASAAQLTAIVPAGAAYGPITVLNIVNGLTAYSAKPFLPTFIADSAGLRFAAKLDFATGLKPLKISLNDINDDGKPDMIVVNQTDNTVSVYKNTSTGTTISFNARINFTTGSSPVNLAVADVDGDGKPDIATTNNLSNTISIFLNTGSGGSISFTTKKDYVTGSKPSGIVITDIDGDGKADIAVTNHSAHTVSFFRNTTTTDSLSFSAKADSASGDFPIAISAGDYDGDGRTDIVVANQLGSSLSIFRNISSPGAFAFVKKNIQCFSEPVYLAQGDIDEDGRLDLIAGKSFFYSFEILLNTSGGGNISFLGGYPTPTNLSPRSVTMNDFTGDGKPDFACANFDHSSVLVIKNESTPGTLKDGITTTLASGVNPLGLTSGDVDGDGKPDLLVANSQSGTISVFRNAQVPPTITSFEPLSALPGSTISVTGTNLFDIRSVKLGGTAVASFNVISSTFITLKVGAGSSGELNIAASGGIARLGGFTYLAPPTITSFTPAGAAEGATITVTGTNLLGTTTVTLGGTAVASFTVLSSTTLLAIVGSGTSGSLEVTTPNGTATRSGFSFLFMPTIASFTPTQLSANSNMIIQGTNFTGVTSVKLGGTAAGGFSVLSSTQMSVLVAQGSSGNVSVTTAAGTAEKSGFVYIPIPTITSFTPASASAGATITLTGTNYTGITSVLIGGTAAASFNVLSPTTLLAVVAQGASGTISVTNAFGSGTRSGFTYLIPPTVTGFNPTSAGTGSFISVTGTGFTGVTSVRLGGTNASSFSVSSANSMTVVVGAGSSGEISVSTAGGTASLPGFNYIATPTITTFTPTAAVAGGTLTVTGTNFTGASSVTLGGTAVASFNVLSSTTMTIVVGKGASGDLSITNSFGTAVRAGFTHLILPAINSFTPTSAITGATITVTGTDFVNVNSVTIGGTAAASFTVLSNTTLTAVVGPGSSGAIGVRTVAGSTELPGFTYIPLPTITSFTPTTALAGTTLRITGTNLTGVTDVTLGGTSVTSFTALSSTVLLVVTGQGSSGNLSVTSPFGDAVIGGFTHLPRPSFSISFSPASGNPGTNVTLRGDGFNPSISGNTVYFGAARAIVTGASNSELTVIAPINATYDVISVLNNLTGLTSYSQRPFLITFTGGGNFSFSNQGSFSSGNKPYEMALGDFDSDGKTDAAAVNQTDNTVSLFRNISGLKNISFSAKQTFATGVGPSDIVVRDVNGDGKPDIITSNILGNTVSVLRNTGSGATFSFSAKTDLSTSAAPQGISVSDINGDGKPDIIVANRDANTLSIFKNTSTPDAVSFASKIELATGLNPTELCVGDFDSDGLPDIGVVNVSSNSFSIFRNTSLAGTISFAIKIDISCGSQPISIITGDIDSDGRQDIVIGRVTTATLEAYKNNSTPGLIAFQLTSNPSTAQVYPGGIAFCDFDGDGKPDLTATNPHSGSNTTTVIKNTSVTDAIAFGSQLTFSSGSGPRSVIGGDMNGDGKPDLLVVNLSTGVVSAYRNTSSNIAPLITALAPLTGTVGSTLLITGANFEEVTSIKLGNATVSSFEVFSSTAISITVPAGASSGVLTVTTLGGTGTINGFTYQVPLTMTSFTPALTAKGGVITITGSDFTGATEVKFGATSAASFKVLSATAIRAVVGEGSSGIVSVRAPAGEGYIGGFTFIAAPPIISSFSPASGGIGATVTIKCINIDPSATGNTVFFGATQATITDITANSITVTVPKGASYQAISVLNNTTGLTGYSTRPFLVTFATNNTITTSSLAAEFGPGIFDHSSSAAIGDLDNDGKPDLVVAYGIGSSANTEKRVVMYRNISSKGAINSETTFEAGIPFNVTVFPRMAMIEDLDGDGWMDVVITASASISILHNVAGKGFFADPSQVTQADFTAGANTGNARIADLNRDGKPEIITADANSNTISIFFNGTRRGIIDGNSFTTKILVPTATEPHRIAVGDIDGDGKADIAVASAGNPGVSIHRNISDSSVYGNIAFASRVDLVSTRSAWGIAMGDIDGDLKPDLVSYNYDANSVSVFRNIAVPGTISTASFEAKKDFTVPTAALNGALGDIDGDGKVDIIVTASSLNIYALKNNSSAGNIALSASISFPGKTPGNYYNFLAVGDLDGDGRSEITVANDGENGRLHIFNNRSPLLAPTITSFTPTSGIIGTSLTVTGTNLVGIGEAALGGVRVSSVTEISPTTLLVTVGNGSSGSLSVTTAGGTAALSGFTFIPPPIITSFTPTSALAGAVITVTGNNFTDISSVSLGGTAVSSFNVLSSTLLTAVVGNGSSGALSVTGVTGIGALTGFTFLIPPTLTSFTPLSAATGATITITGTNLSGIISTTLGGTSVASFRSLSSTTLLATVGNGSSGALSITTAGGTASLTGFVYIPPPTITSFTPQIAGAGATITVTGTNLAGIISTTLGGTAVASFDPVSSTLLTLVVGNGASGTLSITTAGGVAALTGFSYVPAPTITSFAPLSAATGATITVTGTNLSNAISATLGGTAVASFKVISSTTLVAVVGNGSSGTLSITTIGGTAALSGFTYLPPPNISSFSPMSAISGETITVTGTNLSGIISATLGGTAVASFNSLSSTTVTVLVGTGASGPLSITTTGGTAVLSGFTFISEPIIQSFTPLSAGAGATITVTGLNLSGVLSATLGGTAVSSVQTLSSTTIAMVVGNGSSGSLSVTTLAGSAALSGFVYIPPVVITSDSTFCKGDTVLMKSSAVTGNQWYKDGVLIPGATADTYTASTTGVYKVIMTYGGVSYSSVNQVTLVQNAQPLTSFTITGDSSQCLTGNLFRFTNTSSIAGNKDSIVAYKWIFGDNLFSDLADIPHTYQQAGAYQVKLVTRTNRGCSDTTFKNVLVKDPPSIVITNPAAVCNVNNTIVDITAGSITAGSTSGLSFTYWRDSAATTAMGNAATVSASGTFYIKGTNPLTCFTTKPVVVTIYPLPVLSTITGDSTICAGTSSVLANSTKGGSWTSSNPTVGTIDSTGKVTALSAGVSTITYSYTASSTGCSSSITTKLTVLPLPITGKPLLAGYDSDTLTCFFNTVNIASKNTYDKYLWSNGATTSSIDLSANTTVSLRIGSNQNACYSEPSIAVTARKNLTVEPTISRVVDNLVGSSSTTYKWLFNNKLTGDTTQSIPVGIRGIYNISTSIDRVCWNTSKDYLVFFDPPTLRKPFDLIVYPNPTNGIFSLQIKFQGNTTSVIRITIADQAGVQKWDARKIIFNSSSIKIPVSLAIAQGTYVIRVEINGEINTQQLVIL